GCGGGAVVHLQILVRAVAEELGAAGPEVGERGDELLRCRSGLLVEMDRRHRGLLLLLQSIWPPEAQSRSAATPSSITDARPCLRGRGGAALATVGRVDIVS